MIREKRPDFSPIKGLMYMSTVSLMTLFQARAATKPKPEVARMVICLMTVLGSSLGDLGVRIFLAMRR